jgi:hypothetical protein|tara:strand:+ start:82 stop:561 length:480 start_codon:yes stop_codon:yes gene_type:complete
MIELKITNEMKELANQKSKEMGLINNSILRSAGNMAGFLGEQVVLSIIGGEWANTYDYDLISNTGNKVDVKTKQTTAVPRPYYEASVANFNAKQLCDYYAFVRIHKDFTVAWYMGAMRKLEYYTQSNFLNKGDIDPDNNFVVRADCHNLPYSKLTEFYI